MRRGNDVRDPIRDRIFGHSERLFDGFRAVVEPRQDVAVKVSRPVGGIKATRLVPCALCWSKANNKPKIGIRTVPPPMPKRPERIPPATPAKRKPIVFPIQIPPSAEIAG